MEANVKLTGKGILVAVFLFAISMFVLFVVFELSVGVKTRRAQLFSPEFVGEVAVGVLLDEAVAHPEAGTWYLVPHPWAEDNVRNRYEAALNKAGVSTRERENYDRFRGTWRAFMDKCRTDNEFVWQTYAANRTSIVARVKASPALAKEVAFFARYLDFAFGDRVVRDLVAQMRSLDESCLVAHGAAQSRKIEFIHRFELNWKIWKDGVSENSSDDLSWSKSFGQDLEMLTSEERAVSQTCKQGREAQEEIKKSLFGYLGVVHLQIFEIRGVNEAAQDHIAKHWLPGSQIVAEILNPVFEAERLRRDGRLDLARRIGNDITEALKTEK